MKKPVTFTTTEVKSMLWLANKMAQMPRDGTTNTDNVKRTGVKLCRIISKKLNENNQ